MVKILRESTENIKEMPLECIKGATLMSVEEAENLLTQEERVCKYNGKTYPYWLRLDSDDKSLDFITGHLKYIASHVNYEGEVIRCGLVSVNAGTRPALIINLKSSGLKVGDSFKFGNYNFKIIDENLALCEEIIGSCVFRNDWKAEDANVYEKSDIKKYVDNWFDKIIFEYKNNDLFSDFDF